MTSINIKVTQNFMITHLLRKSKWDDKHKHRHTHIQAAYTVYLIKEQKLWRIRPLLGNGSVNTFPKHMLSTIGHPVLGNGPINTHSWQEKTVFSVGAWSQNSSSGVSSRKKMSVSDSDLWTVVTSCNKFDHQIQKPVLLVTQTPNTWQLYSFLCYVCLYDLS
jgi:hypothetical protein